MARYEDDGTDLDISNTSRDGRRRNTEPSGRIAGPALCILAVSVFSAVVFLVCVPVDIGMAIFMDGRRVGRQDEVPLAIARGATSIVLVAVHVFIAVGANLMRQRRQYGIAMASAIISVVPCCSPCYFLGIPFGIWALVVLMDEDVKSSFES